MRRTEPTIEEEIEQHRARLARHIAAAHRFARRQGIPCPVLACQGFLFGTSSGVTCTEGHGGAVNEWEYELLKKEYAVKEAGGPLPDLDAPPDDPAELRLLRELEAAHRQPRWKGNKITRILKDLDRLRGKDR